MSKPECPNYNPTLSEVIDDIKRVADAIGTPPIELKFGKYNNEGGQYSEWQIRRLGGFTAIVKDAFGSDTEKDLVSARGVSNRNTYLARLERQVGDREYFITRLTHQVAESFKNNPVVISPQKKFPKPNEKKADRYNIVNLSDNHFGSFVDPLEVENNGFNWGVAARRFGKLAEEVAHYKLDHRDECLGLVVNVAGDQIEGRIHLDDKYVDLISDQIIGTGRYLIDFFDYQLQFYPKILVQVSPGNHDRVMDAGKGRDRARSQKYDSYLSCIMETVRQTFRNEPRLVVNQPKTPYTTFQLFDHNYLVFHGDTAPSVGNPSKALDIKRISAQLNDFNVARPDSERAHVAFTGHVHFGTYALLDNGIELFVNPSMIGVNTYAQSNGSYLSNPGQWLVEAVRDYPVGDMRLCRLRQADNDARYEKIIKPYNYQYEIC